ncbi:MAG: hypothetical protein ACT4ON_02360 [Bacteroidota bacterium]
MKPVKKGLLLSFIACLFLFFGYYRDFIFKNINALLKAWDYDLTYSLPSSLFFLENWNYNTLTYLKWALTFLFSIIYFLITLATIHLLFKNKKYNIITFFVYVVLLIVSGSFIVSGMIFPNASEITYEFARYLMGMAQSPIILMILFPAFKLSEKTGTISSK